MARNPFKMVSEHLNALEGRGQPLSVISPNYLCRFIRTFPLSYVGEKIDAVLVGAKPFPAL